MQGDERDAFEAVMEEDTRNRHPAHMYEPSRQDSFFGPFHFEGHAAAKSASGKGHAAKSASGKGHAAKSASGKGHAAKSASGKGHAVSPRKNARKAQKLAKKIVYCDELDKKLHSSNKSKQALKKVSKQARRALAKKATKLIRRALRRALKKAARKNPKARASKVVLRKAAKAARRADRKSQRAARNLGVGRRARRAIVKKAARKVVGAALKKRSARSAARALSSRNFGLYAHGFDGLVGLRRRLQQQYAQLRYENGEQQLALPGFPSQLRDNGNESVREEVIIRNIEADGPERLTKEQRDVDVLFGLRPQRLAPRRVAKVFKLDLKKSAKELAKQFGKNGGKVFMRAYRKAQRDGLVGKWAKRAAFEAAKAYKKARKAGLSRKAAKKVAKKVARKAIKKQGKRMDDEKYSDPDYKYPQSDATSFKSKSSGRGVQNSGEFGVSVSTHVHRSSRN